MFVAQSATRGGNQAGERAQGSHMHRQGLTALIDATDGISLIASC